MKVQPMTRTLTRLMMLIAAAFVLPGCGGEAPTAGPASSSDTEHGHSHDDEHSHDDHGHGHAHPSHGPHDGDLIELGNEEYHAELLHDEDAGMVTIYILDGSATKAVAIEAAEIKVNLVADGQPAQFSLAASPDESDPEGLSSRFVSSAEKLIGQLHEDGTDGTLVLTIKGKSYRGELAHDHDHNH